MARSLGPSLVAALVALAGAARADVPCAGDGPPLYQGAEGYGFARDEALHATALVTLQAIPWHTPATAHDPGATAAFGDPVAAGGTWWRLERARLGVCGQSEGLAYRLVYEPWSDIERAATDAPAWGRMSDVAVGWVPARWASLWLGIGKVPLTRGREQPVGALALPSLPYTTGAIAPDRRAGLTVDLDLGVARGAVGVYQAAPRFDLDRLGGVLVVGRLELVPFGPVPHRAWPRAGEWSDRWRGAIGGSGAWRSDGNTSGWLAGGDLAIARGRWYLDGEVLYAKGWPLERPGADPALAALHTRLGAWLESMLLVWREWLFVAARAEYLDEAVDVAGGVREVAFAAGVTALVPGPLVALQVMYDERLRLATGGVLPRGALVLSLTVER